MKLSVTTRNALDPAGEILTWDGDFWGVRIGRAYTSDIDQWAKDNLVGSVCLLLPAHDTEAIQAAETRGFRFMDIRVTLARQTQGRLADVRPHAPEDIDQLALIARSAHRITRFYADPMFPDERCDDLYETWVRSSCAGWADQVLVTGFANGYVTVHVDGDEGSIGLIAVHEDARGKGLGTELVCGAIDWCYTRGLDRIRVVTQGRNTPALRLFQRAGFLAVGTEVWMHRWYQ